MATTRRGDPTPEQIKAVASPLRLRILRLCNNREWTNQELAERLDRDPSTILHHLRILQAAGFVASVGIRQGKSGAYEKPYRSTMLQWDLSFGVPVEGEPPLLTAFRQELAEAGNESIAELTRFQVHLDDEGEAEFIERFLALIEEYREGDDERARRGVPGYGGIMALHRLRAPDDSAD